VGSTPQTQEAEILNLGGFYPRVINAALDKLTMVVQEMQAEVVRAQAEVPRAMAEAFAGNPLLKGRFGPWAEEAARLAQSL
jgi:hypothetical protein